MDRCEREVLKHETSYATIRQLRQRTMRFNNNDDEVEEEVEGGNTLNTSVTVENIKRLEWRRRKVWTTRSDERDNQMDGKHVIVSSCDSQHSGKRTQTISLPITDVHKEQRTDTDRVSTHLHVPMLLRV